MALCLRVRYIMIVEKLSSAAELIRDEYLKKVRFNPRYSLRTFAKQLGMSHTLFSLILAGKRPVTAKQAIKIAQGLKLNSQQTQDLIAAVLMIDSAGKKNRNNPKNTDFVPSVSTVEIEQFKLLSNWLSFALLEEVGLKNFQYLPVRLAKKYQVTTTEIKDVFQRLCDMGLVIELQPNVYKKSKDWFQYKTTESQVAVRNYHRSTLEKAILELNESSAVAFSRRYVGAGVLPIAEARLSEALDEIKKFKIHFLKKYATSDAVNVFQLNLQLFALSHEAKALIVHDQKKGKV
jgi:uncharacterized protein (TIGR02147 family)